MLFIDFYNKINKFVGNNHTDDFQPLLLLLALKHNTFNVTMKPAGKGYVISATVVQFGTRGGGQRKGGGGTKERGGGNTKRKKE